MSANRFCGLGVMSSEIVVLENRFVRFSCIHQNSLKRAEFKLSIGGLNNNIPYMVQKLSTIVQSAWSWQTRDLNMVLNEKERTNDDFPVYLYEL